MSAGRLCIFCRKFRHRPIDIDDFSFFSRSRTQLPCLFHSQFYHRLQSAVPQTIVFCATDNLKLAVGQFFIPSDDLSFVAFDGQNFIPCFTATFTYHRLQLVVPLTIFFGQFLNVRWTIFFCSC